MMVVMGGQSQTAPTPRSVDALHIICMYGQPLKDISVYSIFCSITSPRINLLATFSTLFLTVLSLHN